MSKNIEGAAKKLQGVVPGDLFISFKQRAISLELTMQEAIEESARDWLKKTDPGGISDETPVSLLESIGDLLQRLRRIV